MNETSSHIDETEHASRGWKAARRRGNAALHDAQHARRRGNAALHDAQHARRRGNAALHSNRGFTLIEMMVVLGIVAGLITAAALSIGSLTASDLRNEAMRMTSVMKYTWTQAAINNTQYRMVLDLDNNEYSVQVTDSPVAAPAPEQQGDEGLLPEEAKQLENEQNVEASDPFRDGSSDPFGIYKAPTYEKVQNAVFEGRELKEGLKFHHVWTVGSETPIRKGKVAVGFFPDGFQQQVIIVLTDGDNEYYSIANEPLTGRVKIYSKRIEPDEAFGEPAEVQD